MSLFNTYIVNHLKPKNFLLGVILGFVLCCALGVMISKKARFHHFTRFYTAIEPSGYLYYPTPEELLVTARHQVNHDKILVLIGGNSVFKGVGQNPDEVWSDELQRLLGDQFKVLNFAMDGATMNSFAGVIFRILKKEYSKILYVGTSSLFVPDPIEGIWVYTYLFWDAYYKNLLHLEKDELQLVKESRSKNMQTPTGMEEQIVSYLDSYFYFRNLWNWVSYRFISTAWCDLLVVHPFRARGRYVDENRPDLKQILADQEKIRFSETLKHLQGIVSGMVDLLKQDLPLKENIVPAASEAAKNSFSLQDRIKTLSVFVIYNPKFLSLLTKTEYLGYQQIVDQMRLMLTNLNYPQLVVGENFVPEDYGDLSHLSGIGGKKLAKDVAKKVKQMAILNHYCDSSNDDAH